MDALLLLCNLHAEGPGTWRRLKARGVTRTGDLPRIPIDRLAEFLGVSPALARRFVREAAVFEARTGCSAPRAVEEAVPAWPASARIPIPALPDARVRALPLDEIAPRSRSSDRAARPAWEPALSAATTAAFRSTLPAPPPKSPREPRAPGPVTAATLLRAGLVGDLDTQSCEKLIGEGIRTLGQLAEAPVGRLALCAGIAEAQLGAWQTEARRRLAPADAAGDAERTPESEPEYVLVPHVSGRGLPGAPAPPRPVWTPEPELAPAATAHRAVEVRPYDREGVGGPFA